jgi:hypothetical protein
VAEPCGASEVHVNFNVKKGCPEPPFALSDVGEKGVSSAKLSTILFPSAAFFSPLALPHDLNE